MTIANLFNNLSKKMKKNEIEGILEGQSINWFENTNNFLSVFVEQIKSKIGFFKPVELANTFNGFGQIGFVRNDFFNALEKEGITIEAFLGPVLKQTQSRIKYFEPRHLANTFNGFVTIFLYDNEESNYYSKYFEDIITNIISNIKVKKMTLKI